VDIGGVHVRVELRSWIGANLPCCDRHRLDAALVAGQGHIDGVLMEDDRVVVGEGHTAAAETLGGAGDGVRRRLIGERVYFARFTDIPILTKFTTSIASSRPKRQHRRAWQEVV